MKRFLSMIITIVLVLNVFCMPNLVSLGFVTKAEGTTDTIPNPVDLTSRDDFGIGVNVHSALYAAYPETYLAEQIHAVARMGSKWIRLNGQLIQEGDWSYLDTAVGLCNKYGLKIVMVLDVDRTVSLEYITLLCETYARRYNGEEGRGYVDYFQLWNELDITLLRAKYGGSSPSGDSEAHYYTVPVDGAADLPEYLEYFQAAEKGIHSKDSNSKFMINFSATHCGMVSYFLRNGVKFDMIGWDLYANRPYDRVTSATELTKDYDLIEEKIYDTYGVPVLICETNINTHKLTEEDCLKSDFGMDIYQIAIDNLYLAFNRPWIKGAIMYELLDEPVRGLGAPESCYGLIYNPSGGSGVLDTANEKTIYIELQKMLGGNRNLPLIKRETINLKPYEKLTVGTADDSEIGKEDNNSSSDVGNTDNNSNLNNDISSNPETKPSVDNNANVESKPEVNNSSEIESNSNSDILENNNDSEIISDNSTENSTTAEAEKQYEEVIVENLITPVKDVKTRETSYEMPWLFVILSGAGLVVLAGGAIAVYLIISKKKLKK